MFSFLGKKDEVEDDKKQGFVPHFGYRSWNP